MKPTGTGIKYSPLEIGGTRYAVMPEAILLAICRQFGISATPGGPPANADELSQPDDSKRLAARLIERRQRGGLSQAALARRAGVRVETLNRIERGHVTPDFSTIRKLVVAMNKFEADKTAAEVRRALPR